MRYSYLVAHLLWVVFVGAEDQLEIFEGHSGPLAGSLLFNKDQGSALIEERSVNPLNFVAANLGRRQSNCPYPVICSATTCCPSGTECCGTGIKCCPSTSTCRSTPVEGCCPNTAETCEGKFCADAGSVCCGDFVCPSGNECNTDGGQSCCTSDEIKCSGGCCPAGSSCSTTPGLCQREGSSSIQQSSQVPVTSIRISEASTAASPTASPTASAASCPIQKRALADCKYECYDKKWLPVIEIPNIPGRTDQLFVSMCSGMSNTGGGRGGNSKDWDVLTYAGDGKSAKKVRRQAAKCAGYCAEQKRVFNDTTRLECDEYPPAMAVEGGSGAHRTCIPAAQNSGEQGKRLGDFVNKCKPPKGSSIIVRMKGGCNLTKRDFDAAQPLWARQEDTAGLSAFAASGSELRSLENASSFIYLPFDDLKNGHYHSDVSFEGGVTGISVIDSDGDSYYTSGDSSTSDDSGSKSVDFDVSEIDDGEPQPVAIIIDTGKSQSISYAATATPSSVLATATATNSAGLSGAIPVREMSWNIFLVLVGGSVWLLWEGEI